jgi:hypothetical protein
VEGFGLAHRISRKHDRLLDRVRDASAAGAAGLPGTADTFGAPIGEEYALLVTFRRDRPSTPRGASRFDHPTRISLYLAVSLALRGLRDRGGFAG